MEHAQHVDNTIHKLNAKYQLADILITKDGFDQCSSDSEYEDDTELTPYARDVEYHEDIDNSDLATLADVYGHDSTSMITEGHLTADDERPNRNNAEASEAILADEEGGTFATNSCVNRDCWSVIAFDQREEIVQAIIANSQ